MLGLGYGEYCGTAVGLPTFWLVLCCSWRKFEQISTLAQTIIQLSKPIARIWWSQWGIMAVSHCYYDESNGLTLPTLVLHSILVMLVCVFAETDRTVAFKVLLWSVLNNLNLNLKRGIAFRWIRERSDTALLDVDGITLFFFTGHVISDSCEQGLHQILDHQVIKSTWTHGNYQIAGTSPCQFDFGCRALEEISCFFVPWKLRFSYMKFCT